MRVILSLYVTGIYTYMRSFANNITYGTERGEN